jgi:hypothetical protein
VRRLGAQVLVSRPLDLEALGLRRRRHYDTGATFLSLRSGRSSNGGAAVDHPSVASQRVGQLQAAVPPGGRRCAMQFRCLKVELREGRVIQLHSRGGGVEAQGGASIKLKE